jgi:hypothetical protein
MKNPLSLLILLAFVLAACQPRQAPAPVLDSPTPTSAETSISVEPDPYPYPVPAAAVDSQPPPAPPSVSGAYPDPGDPNTARDVEWQDAERYLLSGMVAHAIQSDALQVVFTLKDGSVLKSVEPAVGDLDKLVSRCGYLCSGINVVSP